MKIISYRHRNAPKAQQRFVQLAIDPLPEWAIDVRSGLSEEIAELIDGPWSSSLALAEMILALVQRKESGQ